MSKFNAIHNSGDWNCKHMCWGNGKRPLAQSAHDTHGRGSNTAAAGLTPVWNMGCLAWLEHKALSFSPERTTPTSPAAIGTHIQQLLTRSHRGFVSDPPALTLSCRPSAAAGRALAPAPGSGLSASDTASACPAAASVAAGDRGGRADPVTSWALTAPVPLTQARPPQIGRAHV